MSRLPINFCKSFVGVRRNEPHQRFNFIGRPGDRQRIGRRDLHRRRLVAQQLDKSSTIGRIDFIGKIGQHFKAAPADFRVRAVQPLTVERGLRDDRLPAIFVRVIAPVAEIGAVACDSRERQFQGLHAGVGCRFTLRSMAADARFHFAGTRRHVPGLQDQPVASRVERFEEQRRLGRRLEGHRAIGLNRHRAQDAGFEARVAGSRHVGVFGREHAHEAGPRIESIALGRVAAPSRRNDERRKSASHVALLVGKDLGAWPLDGDRHGVPFAQVGPIENFLHRACERIDGVQAQIVASGQSRRHQDPAVLQWIRARARSQRRKMNRMRRSTGLGRCRSGKNRSECVFELRSDVGVINRRSHFALDENATIGKLARPRQANRGVAGPVVELKLACPEQVPFFAAIRMHRDQIRFVLDERRDRNVEGVPERAQN